jgi:hypothetical protein
MICNHTINRIKNKDKDQERRARQLFPDPLNNEQKINNERNINAAKS